MENKIIAKTLLSIYPGLQDYEDMLGSRAQTHALCSFHTPLLTERIIDKIINLNVKKQTIQTLRLGMAKILGQLPTEQRVVVQSYYRDFEPTVNTHQRAQRLGIAERTYFRRLANATNYLAKHLPALGINFFTWQYLLRNHPWIKEAYHRQLTHA